MEELLFSIDSINLMSDMTTSILTFLISNFAGCITKPIGALHNFINLGTVGEISQGWNALEELEKESEILREKILRGRRELAENEAKLEALEKPFRVLLGESND